MVSFDPLSTAIEPGRGGALRFATAVVISTDPLTVQIGGGDPVRVTNALPTFIVPGDVVHILVAGQHGFVLGVQPGNRVGFGTLLSYGDGFGNVQLQDKLHPISRTPLIVKAAVLNGVTYPIGSYVALMYNERGSCVLLGTISNMPANVWTDEGVGGGTGSGTGGGPVTLNLAPAWLGTWYGGTYDTSKTNSMAGVQSAWQGQWEGWPVNIGAISYGDSFGSAAGKTCTVAQITLTRANTAHGLGGGVEIRARALAQRDVTSAVPAMAGDQVLLGTLARGETATFSLPTSWGDLMRSGSAWGVVFNGSAYAQIVGPSATLHLEYS